MAAATDLFRESAPLFQTTLSAAMLSTDTAATLASVVGIPTNTGVTITVDQFNAAGTATPTLREVMTGVVSGSQIIDLIRGQDGTTAQSHTNGAIVQMVFTSQANNDLMTGITKQHTQSGTHTGITTDTLTASGVITANGTITGSGYSAATLTNPYKFSVYWAAGAGGYLATSGQSYIMKFDNKLFDTGNNFSLSTWLFTAPIAGLYWFNGSVMINNGSNVTAVYGQIQVNGSTAKQNEFQADGQAYSGTNVPVSGLLKLNAGDTVGLYAASGTPGIGIASGGPSATWFEGFLVSAT